jgi:hypothetical protein
VAGEDAAAMCEAAVNVPLRVSDPILIADALLTFAGACERTQAWGQADAFASDALDLYREAGDPYGATWALAEQGWYDIVHRRLDDAKWRLAVELRRRHGDDAGWSGPCSTPPGCCSPAARTRWPGAAFSTAWRWHVTAPTSST